MPSLISGNYSILLALSYIETFLLFIVIILTTLDTSYKPFLHYTITLLTAPNF